MLNSEQRLVDHESRVEGYCEFVAIYLELQLFSPDLLPIWFPSLAGKKHLDEIFSADVDAESIFQATQLYGAPSPDLTSRQSLDEARVTSTRQDWSLGIGVTPSDRAYLRQLRRRERALEKGNTVGAATCAMRAAERATSDEKRHSAREKARSDVNHLVQRLRAALNFHESDEEAWQSSLWELATNSIHGFWNADKRLLFDLQKVCLDHERVIYKVDLVKWVVSRGKRPLRRALTNVREVMMAKHLASCAGRLVHVRLSGRERDRLDGLLHEAAHLAEDQMRERMRPALQQTLQDVGLQPDNLPDQVARDKLVEDSLDCIAERGYLTMGYLRDAISRNDLKLPDLKHASELIRGDHLLRSDDRLDVALDGVYRRGEFYLRWLQITSSIFFGTPIGRFATLYLMIPFGGAKVIVVGAEHIVHLFTGHTTAAKSSAEQNSESDTESMTSPDAATTTAQAEQPLAPSLTPATNTMADTRDVLDRADGPSPENLNNPLANPGAHPADSGPHPANPDSAPDLSIATAVKTPRTIEQPVGGQSNPASNQLQLISLSNPSAGLQDTVTTTETLTGTSKAGIDSRQVSGTSGTESTLQTAHDSGDNTAGPATTKSATTGSINVENTVVETVRIEPVDDAFRQVITREISSLSLVLVIGFMLMALIHIPRFRQWAFRLLKKSWKVSRKVLVDAPMKVLRLPVVQMLWRNRTFVRIRRIFISPTLFSIAFCQWLPWLTGGVPKGWVWVGTISILLSLALNSRLGRDAEELTAEWLANLWYHFRARVLMAVLEWVIDFFKMLLGFVERFLYAVDEWLRFHNAESWFTVLAKAVLGVVWSFASFLIRIYVNLLIEPTFHPVKHFPVVTVAHKMFLPFLVVLEHSMRTTLSPYLGTPLAVSVTWFNIFFLPGLFGFAVWELKENWRLYEANRKQNLYPSLVGSHGETLPRLMKPGFHSGTLPKLFRRMRRLEQKETSFRRFSLRRAAREQLEHVERDLRRFVDREFVKLLELTSVWKGFGIGCGRIHAASNSIQIEIECDRLGDNPLTLLFQEQSGWAVATVAKTGWLCFASGDQTRVLEHALKGFYRKAGIELVREQLQENLTHKHEYDIN